MSELTEPVVIIDYGMGNVGSIANMLRKLELPSKITGDPSEIARATRLILPGVGAFDHGMRQLESLGLLSVLHRKALHERVPILGICLGMQLFSRQSEEGRLAGLGWIDADVRRFRSNEAAPLRVPHMGWNLMTPFQAHPVFQNLNGEWRFYFVHSYHVCCDYSADVAGVTSYGKPFVSAVARENLVGVQFHPEKSHRFGMQLLENFARWNYSPSQKPSVNSPLSVCENSLLTGRGVPHLEPRVIPCLLLKRGGLVKTVRFRRPNYVGDPINAVRIFNDKQVDELTFLDITASLENRSPDYDLIRRIAGEAFMPIAYGGGVRNVDDIRRIIQTGVEKVVINSQAAVNRSFLRAAADQVGSQSIVASIDVRRRLFGRYEVFSHSGTRPTGKDPVTYAQEMADAGAGEIVLNSIDRDGAMRGYDISLLQSVTSAVSIPVIALGGASCMEDFHAAIHQGGASAVAAGSLFVYRGKHRAVLITYPEKTVLNSTLARDAPCLSNLQPLRNGHLRSRYHIRHEWSLQPLPCL